MSRQLRADQEDSPRVVTVVRFNGIPYLTKDLLALSGYPTTWGAMPYRDQMIDETATVIARLEQAGAVHLAKVSLGGTGMGRRLV